MPVINLKSNSKSRSPLDEGTWDAVIVEVNSGESTAKKTPYIEFVYKIEDPEAVDTEGNAYKGKVWDKYFFTENATWRFKKVAGELGIELPDDEEDIDLADLAAHVAEDAVGRNVNVTTGLREYNEKQYTDVKNVEA